MAFTEHIKVALGLKSDDFKRGLAGAESKTKKFSSNMKGYLAGALGTAVLVRTTKAIVDFGASIGDLSDRISVNSEFLQEFQFAATQSGSSAEEANKALEKLSKSVGEAEIGTKLYADAFKRLGVDIRDAEGNLKSTEQITKDVANGLKEIDDPAVKVKTAFDLMGRSGTAMIQVMQNGEQGLDDFAQSARDMGMIVGQDNVRQLQEASGKIEIMNRSWKVFLAEIATPVANAFQVILVGLRGLKLLLTSIPTIVETFGRTFERVFVNTIRSAITDARVKVAELQLAFEELNPFADQADVRQMQDKLESLKQTQIQINREARDFASAKAEILVEDEELMRKNEEFGDQQIQLQNQMIDIFGNKIQKQQNLNNKVKEEKDEVANVVQERTREENQINRVIDRVDAMKRGGLDALKVVQDRHDLEDRINKLMADGNLDREQAEILAKKIKDAETDELNLQEKIKKEKEEQVRLKKQKEDRAKLLADLEKERALRADLVNKENQINDARQRGDKRQEEILEKRRIAFKLGQVEAEQREELGRKLMEELKQKQDLRAEAKKQMDILQLRANGQDDLADKLQRELDLKNQIKDIADDLQITEREALQNIQDKLNIENDIELAKNRQKQTEIQTSEIRDLASQKANDAVDREERKRILAAQSIIRLEDQINELKGRADNRAKREVERLESIKERKLDIALSDQTKTEFEKLKNEGIELENDHAERIAELGEKRKQIAEQEKQDRAKQKAILEKIENKKIELLNDQEVVAERLKEGVQQQGQEVADALNNAGEEIVNKIEDIKPDNSALAQSIATLSTAINGLNFTNTFSDQDLDKINELAKDSTIRDVFANLIQGQNEIPTSLNAIADKFASIETAISSIEIPDPISTPIINNIKIEIDTESLAKESTLLSIDYSLQGKYRNE